MEVRRANREEVACLTAMSKAAFGTDVMFGGKEGEGPTGYDSVEWHGDRQKKGELYSFVENTNVVGGVVINLDPKDNTTLYVHRLFLDPTYHGMGYGIKSMLALEERFPDIHKITLDTPVWNMRTNRFYQKLGYVEQKRDKELVYYEKKLQSETERNVTN